MRQREHRAEHKAKQEAGQEARQDAEQDAGPGGWAEGRAGGWAICFFASDNAPCQISTGIYGKRELFSLAIHLIRLTRKNRANLCPICKCIYTFVVFTQQLRISCA